MEGTEGRQCILFKNAPISLPKIYLFVNIFRASDLDCKEATTPFSGVNAAEIIRRVHP